jgi:hypothetical protein
LTFTSNNFLDVDKMTSHPWSENRDRKCTKSEKRKEKKIEK